MLVGGGHSHVQLLRRLAMEPLPGVRVSVVVDRPVAVYSGMVPGVVAGQYTRRQAEIDVRPLARRAGVAVLSAAATRIDAAGKRVELVGRPPIPYDVCSVNIGSTVAGADVPGVRQHAIPTRPIAGLIDRLDELVGGRLVVVGAGPAGVELGFCAEARLAAQGVAVAVTVLGAGEILPGRSEGLRRRVQAEATRRGITLRADARVAELVDGTVVLEGGERLPADSVLWAAGAAAHGVFAASGLPTDSRGFVQVDDQLRVEGTDGLFAAGDCAVLASWPEIPKAGVYAVRQGPVLDDNVRAALHGRPLRAYRPQRDFLSMLNLGDGTALADKWGLAFGGGWVWRWKDHIDRVFMDKFVVLAEDGGAPAFERGMPPMGDGPMICGGCAAKVGEGALERALRRLGPAPGRDAVVGTTDADDAAVVQTEQGLLALSVDAFPAFVDDPWLVGRVGALNAISDLQAQGVQPRFAQALVTLPRDVDEEEWLVQVMTGVRAALDEAGTTLVGGHSTVGPELVVGLSVLGLPEGELLVHDALVVGMKLVLSRPLGTGVLLHADMAGRAEGPWIDAAIASMLRGNGDALAVARRFGLTAGTDVTGFGLAGHLGELLRRSGCSAELALSDLPALPGAVELLRRGERSSFHDANRKAIAALSTPAEPGPKLELLFDPQTAGGMLLGVPPEQADAVVAALREAGDPAVVIGVVAPARPDGALAVVR